jgi:hypothetical protein
VALIYGQSPKQKYEVHCFFYSDLKGRGVIKKLNITLHLCRPKKPGGTVQTLDERINDVMKKTLSIVLVTFLFIGCDPGWHYHVYDYGKVQNGQKRYRLPEESGLETTVSCSLFSLGLTVEIEIVNHGSGSLVVDPKLLTVADANRTKLPRKFALCAGSKNGEVLSLSDGQSCKLFGYFQVNPTLGPFGLFTNRDLKHLTILIDGLAREEEHIPLQFFMEWDL